MKNTATAARDARALDPWVYPAPPPEFDVARLDVGFETVAEAEAERDLRVGHLRRAGSVQHGQLADTLRSCVPNARCRSAACPICCRRFRRWFVGGVLATFGDADLVAATLIPGGQAVATDGLRHFSPRRLGDTLRQQLRRVGLGDEIVAGGVDGDYDEAHEVWQPHLHLIAPAALRPAFDELRGRYFPRSDRVHRPVLIQPVNDPAEQVSYCAKAYWPQVPRYLNAAGKERRAPPRRLDEPLHVDWLLWRSRVPLADLIFLQGIRRYGCELRRTGSSGR